MSEALTSALVAADALARDVPIADRTGTLTVRAAAAGPAEIGIYGEIGWEVTARDVRDALKGLAGRDLVVRINSPGGSAFDGFAIFNMLSRHDGRITVQIEALAASAASYIAMAGDDIEMPAASFMMIHNASVLAIGDKNTLDDAVKVLRRIDGAMAAIYAARTGVPIEEIAAMMDAETWMDAEEAVARGFATAVLANELAPAAHALSPRAAALMTRFQAPPSGAQALSVSTMSAIPPAASKGSMMDPNEINAGGNPPAPVTTTVAVVPQAASLTDLQALVARSAGRLGADFVVAQMAAGATMDAARDAALQAVASEHADRPAMQIGIIRDERDTARAGMEAAISSMAGDNKADISTGPGRVYAGMSLREIARASVVHAGGKPDGMDARAIAGAALGFPQFMAAAGMHTTSDFPLILGNVARKTMLEAFTAVPSEWRLIARTTSHPDFKPQSYARLSEAPDLLEVPEHAEFTYGTMGESGGSIAVKTFGRIFAITRQALINDDSSSFSSLPMMFGNRAAKGLADKVWGILTSNPVMSDGITLFHASHGNLASPGTAITEVALAAAQTAVRMQTSKDGSPLGLRAKFLIVSPAKEFEARKLLATVFNLSDGSANVSAEGLTLIVAPITGNAWYLMADPATIPGIIVPFLNGVQVPTTEQRIGFEVDGLEIKARIDYDVGAIEWRGMFKNPGA